MRFDEAELDTIEKRIQAIDFSSRRRTLTLALIPVLLGIVVIILAWWTVDSARQSVNIAQGEVTAAESKRLDLDVEIADLRTSKARLDEDIAAREALLRRFESTLPEGTKREAEIIQQGMGYGKRGAYGRAVGEYEAALEVNPDNSLTHNLLGYAYYQQHEYDNAIACFMTSIELDEDFADPYFNLSAALWAIGEFDASANALETAIELNPAMRSRAHRDPAYAPIRRHLEVDSSERTGLTKNEQEWINRGVMAAQNGDLDAALEAYDKALEENSSNASVHNWRGYALFRMERFDAAVASLREAVRLAPENAEHHYNLAVALCAAGDHGAASQAMTAAFEIDPEYEVLARQDPNTRCVREVMSRRAVHF